MGPWGREPWLSACRARSEGHSSSLNLVPEPYEQPSQVEATIGRLGERLRQVAITVRLLPGAGMHIPGEALPGGHVEFLSRTA